MSAAPLPVGGGQVHTPTRSVRHQPIATELTSRLNRDTLKIRPKFRFDA